MAEKEYIEREVAIKAIEKYGTGNGSALGHHSGAVDCAICEIEAIPAADVAPIRHGRWKRMVGMMPPEYHGRHECSRCGKKALDWKFHEELSNYCPNCGARMDGE